VWSLPIQALVQTAAGARGEFSTTIARDLALIKISAI